MGLWPTGWVEWKRHVLNPDLIAWRPLADVAAFVPPGKHIVVSDLLFGREGERETWDRGLPDDVSPFVRSAATDPLIGGTHHTWLTLGELRPYADALPTGWKVLYTFMFDASQGIGGWLPEHLNADASVRLILWWVF